MSLNRKSIVDFYRAEDPDFYAPYSDAEIFRTALAKHPEIAQEFEYVPKGVSLYEKKGGHGDFFSTGQVLTHTERFQQFFPKIAEDIDVGITGILFDNPELANEKRKFYDGWNEFVFENNPRLQADIHWKQTEPGWTSFDAAARAFSEAAPSLAVSISGMVAGAGVTAAGGVLGAPGMATTGAAYLTAMAPILLMETGSHYTESLGTFIDEYGMSPEEAQDYAQVSSLAYGAISSSLELLGVKHFTAVGNSIMKGVGRESLMDAGERIYTEKAMRKIVDYGVGKSALVRGTTRLGAGSVGALSQGLVEGVTESLQSLTGMSIQRAMEMGAEGDPSDILDRLQGAFVEAAKEKQWMEEGFAGFTTGIFGFGGSFIRGTESQKRFDKLQESLKKADKDLETSLGAEGIDIDDEGVVDGNLFGSFLDSILDPKLGGEVQESAQDDGGVLAKRITETVEIEDAGFKILQAIGANKDLVSEIVNHENSDKLLEEVRKSLNTQRGDNSQIAKGDTDAIVETLEAFSNYGELQMPSDEATETFGDEVKRTPTIQWQTQGTPDIDEQAPDTRQDMDSRESGQGPDDAGNVGYQERVASDEISDPETEKQLAAQASQQISTKGEGVDTTPDASGEVAILELAKGQLVEKRNALPKNDKKGRDAIGKQIFGLQQNIDNLKKGVTTTATTTPTEDTSPETDEPTTIRDGDTVSIGGKGRFKGMFGTVVGDTKPGEEKGSYKIKLEGGGTATIAKSVVTKEIEESPKKKSPPSKEVDTEKLIKEYNNLKQFRNVIVAEEGNLKPIDKRIGDIEKQLEGAGVKVGEAQAPATVTKVDQQETDNFVVHSGGALNTQRDNRRDSADLVWEDKLKEKGVTTESHSFQGHNQGGENKIVHSETELKAADDHINKANETLGRTGKGWTDITSKAGKYVRNLFRRNWHQVKDASQVLAVADINADGQVEGGTAVAVQMAIDNNKPVYVYDQKTNLWKTWDGEQFVTTDTPTLAPNSATIGTREITATGKAAIDDVINKTFTQDQTQDVETTQTEDVHPAILEERQKRHDENIKLQKTRSLKELRAVAKEHGFPNHQKMTKKQIIEALENQTPSKLMDESVQFPDSDAKLQKIIDDYEARKGASGGVYRSGITAEDVHNAADEAGLDVDTDEFRSLSKQVVGQEHIDNMSNNQRGRMIDHLEGRTAEPEVTETPEAADPNAVAEFTPEQMEAINDPSIPYSPQDALMGEPVPPKQTKTNDPEQKQKDSESTNYDDEMDLLQEKGSSKEILAREDKELRDKILKRLKKFFPHVDVKTFDGVLKIHGIEVVGWATERAIAWSTTDATLDTIPHEYAHIYVKLLANEKIIKLGIKKYETEEKLVQAIGEYYTNRMRNKSLMKRMKIWLKQFANRLKRYFGVEPKNKEDVMKFIAEEFFQGRWLGIEVEVGAGWIDFQERRTSSELSELGNMIDEASGADGTVGEESDSNLKEYPTDVKLSNMFNSLLGIYIDKKDIPNIIELAQKSRSFEEYKNNLWNWATQMAAKRQMKGDDKIRDKNNLSNRENGKLHLDWIKANRRINNWLRDDNTTKTLNNRVYQHLIFGNVRSNPEGLQIRGKRDLANDKDHPISSTRNFVEEEIRIGVHENRPIMLPVKQILNKRTRRDGKNFYVKASYDLTIGELEKLQDDYSNRFINNIKNKIQVLKKDALAKLEEGVSEEDVKRDLIQSLIDLGGKDIGTTLLSVIGSKLGDHSAIISTKAAETPMTLTPEKFKNILDNAVENNLIRPEHRDMMMKDSNFESLENNNRDIINLPWSQYIVNKALDEDLSINDLLSTILDNDLAYMGEMKNKMAQSLAQLRFWQDIRTPDYFMYENSASDSMVRLSIDLAEGPTPIGSGKGRLMIIDADSKIRNTRNDHNNEAIEYDKVDGATFVGSGYMDKLAKALGYGKGEDGTHKLWQLKTFIRQRTMNEETGDVDYLGMKHMMFTVSDGMIIENKDGDEIARVVTRQGQTYWRNVETGELFDMIASPNEAKMTFGGFASTQQKIDAFGEGDYENGYYKIHEIDESSIAVTQMSKGSKTSAAHPIAFAELLLDMGFESKEVQGLLKEIRGRYIDVLNHYTDTIQSFHENPALLKEYITKNRDENEVPDELEELIDLIDDNGMGIFHDALYTHIKPVLNSRIIQDGINKARSFNNDSSVLYLKPVTNLPLKEMEDSTGHKGLMASAQNTTVFKHIEQLYFRSIGVRLIDSSDVQVTVMEKGEEVQRSWDDISFGKKIDILNDYLAENETWTLVHRNPLQKVTAPVLRRMHKLVKGSHGETFFMSEEDVKNVIDGDWDGDKGAVEFISESHSEAMEKWHNSDAHTNANKILKLEFFGERTDRDESIADTSVLSRSDMNDEVSRNSMADGSTGIMVNAMTIARQLFHKKFEMSIDGKKYKIRVADFDKKSDEGTVMDYLPLDIGLLNRNKGELLDIIKSNGDYIVDADGNTIDLDSKIEATDVELYLKTTKANELSLLFQMAVDGAKYRFYSQIINKTGKTPFDFAISRMFERSDKKPLSEMDIRTLSTIYSTQNMSKQRGGKTQSGLAATYEISIAQSDALLNRINKERPDDSQLKKQDSKGRTKGTKTNKNYAKSFLTEVLNAISSRWQNEWYGHSPADIKISMENNITPLESLMMSTGYKLKQSDEYLRHTNTVLRKEAHLMANQVLMERLQDSEFYDNLINGRLQDDYQKAEDFIYEKMDLPDAGDGRLSDVVQKYKDKNVKSVSFHDIWTMLKNYKYSQDAVKADLDEAYIGFVDRFLDKWNSLTPESQHWVTLRMLAGTQNTMYVMKLLPIKLQSKEMLGMYLKAYGEAFDSEIFEQRIDAAGGLQNLEEIAPQRQFNRFTQKGMYGAFIGQVHKVNKKNQKEDDKMNVCGTKGGK